MSTDATNTDLANVLAELREQKRRVAAILAAEDARDSKLPSEASAAARPPAGADDAAKAAFWEARFAATRRNRREGSTP
jgi:hypothetical protein